VTVRTAIHKFLPIAVVLAVGTPHTGIPAAEVLTVSACRLVSSRVFAPGIVEESYVPVFTHAGAAGTADATAVRAIAWSRSSSLQMVDAFVRAGNIPAGASLDAAETFTVRRKVTVPFDPSQLGWSVRFIPDSLVDRGWYGTWEVTARYFDVETGHLVNRVALPMAIGEGDSLGAGLVPEGVGCRASSGETGASVECRIERAGLCRTKGSIQLALARDGDALSGEGSWSVRGEGVCPGGTGPSGQRFELSATRVSASEEFESSDRLLSKLLDLPLPLRDLARETAVPAALADCADGGHARYVFPAFASEAQCTAFVTTQGGGAR
jgi:hypothetical protein